MMSTLNADGGHPNVLKLLEHFEDEKYSYTVMFGFYP